MKKHLLGLALFCIAFLFGFSLSPLRFQSVALGHTTAGWFVVYTASDFVKASFSYESADDVADALERFELYLNPSPEFPERELVVLERTADRGVVNFVDSNFGNAYCIYRLKGELIFSFCSVSLRHAVELERQEMADQLKRNR